MLCRQFIQAQLRSTRQVTQNFVHKFQTSSSFNMPIKVGQTIPSVELYENTPGEKVNIADLCKGKKVVLFAVPGAFTPGCSKSHLPSYVADFDKIKSKGVDEIVCVSINDPFVMAAWGKDQGADGKVRMLADTHGELTKAVDMELDLSDVLGNVRSKRYAVIVEDGTVKALNVEPDGKGLTCTLSKSILDQL